MGIVYSCLTTMAICTISAMHFDLTNNTSHRLGFREKIVSREFWKAIGRKLGIWSAGLLMPEILANNACYDYYRALRDHAFMKTECENWTFKLSMFAGMNGFSLEDGDVIDSGRTLLRRGVILDADVCKRLEYEISDKSKADVLTKSIAIIQITRFLLEIIARAASSFPISPLEYFTCAQVFCALLMYVFWFDKPHGVQEKTRLRVKKGEKRNIGDEEPDLNSSILVIFFDDVD